MYEDYKASIAANLEHRRLKWRARVVLVRDQKHFGWEWRPGLEQPRLSLAAEHALARRAGRRLVALRRLVELEQRVLRCGGRVFFANGAEGV